MPLKMIFTSLGLLFSFILNAQNPEVKVLRGATLYDGTGNKIENSVIIIRGNQIEQVGAKEVNIPEGAEVIDLSGKFIMPGMVDAHVHFFQTAFFDSRPDAADLRDSIPMEETIKYQRENPDRYYKAYLGSGVTAVYDVGDYEWTFELQEKNEGRNDAPHVAAAGPLITPAPKELISIFNLGEEKTFVHLASPETGRKAVKANSQAGSTGIKVWGFRPEDSEFLKSIEAVAVEIEVQDNKMIAHATNLDEAKLALKLGAELLVHSVEDTIVDQEFLDLLKENQALYNPTMIVSRGYYNTYRALAGHEFDLYDPNALVDEKTRKTLKNAEDFAEYIPAESMSKMKENFPRMDESLKKDTRIMESNLKKVYEAGVPIVVGTDAGNPGTLHGLSFIKEIEAMQAAGIPAKDLIVMATRNGAMAMERLDDFGTIEKGKLADLIVLEKDPGEDIGNLRSLQRTMRGGEFYDLEED